MVNSQTMDKRRPAESKEGTRGAGKDVNDNLHGKHGGSDRRQAKKPRIGEQVGTQTTTAASPRSRLYPEMPSTRRISNNFSQLTTRGKLASETSATLKTGTASSGGDAEQSTGNFNDKPAGDTSNISNGDNSLENREKMAAAMLCRIMDPSAATTTGKNDDAPDEAAAGTYRLSEDAQEGLQRREELAVSMLCSMAPKKEEEPPPSVSGLQSHANREQMVATDEKEAPKPDTLEKEDDLQRKFEITETDSATMLCNMPPEPHQMQVTAPQQNLQPKPESQLAPEPPQSAAQSHSEVEIPPSPPRYQLELETGPLQVPQHALLAQQPCGRGVQLEPNVPALTPKPVAEPEAVIQLQFIPESQLAPLTGSTEPKKLLENDSQVVKEKIPPQEMLTETPYMDMLPSDEEAEQEEAKKKRRRRDVSKPTLDSLVQDKFGGDVFHFLECVETEMNQHNFTATGLARKYGAVNCQSRFRTIVAELKEEPIVGMSRLWKERVQAYLRSKRGEDAQTPDAPVDERLRLVKRFVKKSVDTEASKARLMQNSDEKLAATALCTMAPSDEELELEPPPRKRNRPMVEEGAKTTLDVLVQEKFGGDTFHFLESVEKEMNKEGFTATGLARKYGAVNCQSRFRTIVAELKGEPIVGMSRLWKERVQAYLRSKESDEGAEEDLLTSEVAFQEDTLCLVQDNSKCKPPGTVGMFVRQNFGSDFNRFLGSLEEEMKLPGFTAAGYARRHQITEGKKMLINIVAELKRLPNTTMTQTWKDRVRTYLTTKGKAEKDQTPPVGEESNAIVEDACAVKESDEVYLEASFESGAVKPMTLRFTEEGHPLGVLDTLVQEKFSGDVFSFLDYLEKDIRSPDFTAGTFARKHGVTGGKRTLQRIVAQLKGESAHSSQMWKDRVQAYMQYKGGSENLFANVATGASPGIVQMTSENIDENHSVENSEVREEEVYTSGPEVGV